MKKLWNWIWYSSGWYWTNTITGEKKDSSPFLKIVCLLTIVYVVIGLPLLLLLK